MANKITLLISLLSYAFIVSQSFMYILSLRKAQLDLSAGSYIELRHLIDVNMRANFRWPTYLALLSTLALAIMNIDAPAGMFFVCTVIAFAGLVIDVILTLKRSIPLNNIINKWTPTNYPGNWAAARKQWLDVFRYRQIVNTIGFISLLIGGVFYQ